MTNPPNTPKKRDNTVTIIKKYANRRLYDTGRSSYVTLEDLCEMVKEEREFVVQDAKTGEDLTRAVLTQIIVEQEGRGGQTLLPIPFLRQLIGFYGDSLQSLVPNYLEQTFGNFTAQQEKMRDALKQSLGGIPGMGGMMMNPVGALEELGRKNVEMFENAMRAWAPFTPGAARNEKSTAAAPATAPTKEARLNELKKNMAALQKEIEQLGGDKK